MTRNKMRKINKQPLVSVIMPVYNAGDFLRPAIKSILKQTYKNFELIIIDDASTDNSWAIIKDFKTKNPRKIITIKLKRNLNKGGDACANVGYRKAKGEFVARMDADDISDPKRLEKQVDYLLKNKDIFMVGTQAWVIDKKGEIIGEKKVPQSSGDIYKNYFVFHPMIHPTIMLRKKQVERKNLYKTFYSANNDLFTFLGFLKDKKFVNLPEKLLYYRVHDKNDSFNGIKEKFFNTLKIRFWAIKKLGFKPTPRVLGLNLIQLLVVSLLPEKLIFVLYMLAKGIYSPKELVVSLVKRLRVFFTPIGVKLSYVFQS